VSKYLLIKNNVFCSTLKIISSLFSNKLNCPIKTCKLCNSLSLTMDSRDSMQYIIHIKYKNETLRTFENYDLIMKRVDQKTQTEIRWRQRNQTWKRRTTARRRPFYFTNIWSSVPRWFWVASGGVVTSDRDVAILPI